MTPMGPKAKAELIGLLRLVPVGRVVTLDAIAAELKTLPNFVATMINNLSSDERDIAPWHRVVAKGGAIGRGPHRDQQFARLVREGVMVSPAGIVQDMSRVVTTDFDAVRAPKASVVDVAPIEKPAGRSRGMKSHPGT